MKKKTGLILSGVFLFSFILTVGVVMVALEETSAGASVTVNEFVDITLTDAGATGFNFGSNDPSTTNNKEAAQTDGVGSALPAATVTREATSNVNVKIRLKGDNFAVGSDTLPVTNVAYDGDGAVDEGTDTGPYTQESLSTTYPTGSGTNDPWATLTSGSPDVEIWFWLDVPSGQAAGTYSSSFSFEGSA